jgi:hypothetical protein
MKASERCDRTQTSARDIKKVEDKVAWLGLQRKLKMKWQVAT